MNLKNYIEENFKDFAKWARVQVFHEMERYSRIQSIEFVKWLYDNGYLLKTDSTSNKPEKWLYEKFTKHQNKHDAKQVQAV